MNRRAFTRNAITGGLVAIVAPSVVLQTACGPSKEQAVRYTNIAIGYLTDLKPLLGQIGGSAVTVLIDKAIPALEKLKKYLEDNDLPQVGNAWDTVESVLGQVGTALLQLPPSATRTTIIGIVGAVNLTLRTVRMFIKAETPPSAMASMPSSMQATSKDEEAILKAFQASRF